MDIYGILAFPAKHSLSPAMHNTGFKALNIDAEYRIFEVPSEDLQSFIQKVRDEDIEGLSISKPHKENIMELLDIVDDVAKTIGAVNTVVNRGGELHGTNVDWIGVQEPIEEITEIKGKKAVILGAGGAARAACFALRRNNAKETIILNRTVEHAQELGFEFECKYGPLDDFEKYDPDIVIQATSAGLNKEEGVQLVPKELLKPSMVILEMIYTPLKTKIVKDALEVGAKVITGDKMLLHQGYACFEIWTQQKAPREEMAQAVREHLN